MMTTAERRRQKLAAFCVEHGLRVVAEASGLNWQYIDQALKQTLLAEKKTAHAAIKK